MKVLPQAMDLVELALRPWSSGSELVAALKEDEKVLGTVNIDRYAEQIVRRIQMPASLQILRIALVTPRMLGLDGSHSRQEIYAAARAAELEECPPLVGPAYMWRPNPPLGEKIFIGMSPVSVELNVPEILVVQREEVDHHRRTWLRTDAGAESIQFSDTTTWAFVA